MPAANSEIHSLLHRLVDNLVAYQARVSTEFLDHLVKLDTERGIVDIAAECGSGFLSALTVNPMPLLDQQIDYCRDQIDLNCAILQRLQGNASEPVIRPEPEDHRFRDPAWDDSVFFSYLQQSYLLLARHALQTVRTLEGISPRRRKRLAYFTRQFVSALAPTNFPLTNPEVLRRTLESRGENLIHGLQLLLDDHNRSTRILNICMSRPDAFQLGKDLACTPGQVVAENALMQLIQYEPATPQVYKTPILIVPSWINKYYILDLAPNNSFIKWLVEQGHTVFVISWVNPDARHREAEFSTYMNEGPLAALDRIEALTGEHRVSAIGYCLGGILLACTAAYLEGGSDHRLASTTYLASSMDFSDPGDLGMFIDEATVAEIEQEMSEKGFLDGRLLAAGFNLLRENDLYWSYYITNYLKGERPQALDILHWNTDNTNTTAANHSFVLRELHLHNRLIEAGGIALNGRAIDLRDIGTPTYILATEKDHIAQWRSTYTATLLQRGPVRFVLAGSGHIAGIINPPLAEKYHYYVNDKRAPNADAWFAGAHEMPGSWWPDWQAWQQPLAGGKVPARSIRAGDIIEPAPGRYVYRRLSGTPDPVHTAAA